jgi:hypothetical protein
MQRSPRARFVFLLLIPALVGCRHSVIRMITSPNYYSGQILAKAGDTLEWQAPVGTTGSLWVVFTNGSPCEKDENYLPFKANGVASCKVGTQVLNQGYFEYDYGFSSTAPPSAPRTVSPHVESVTPCKACIVYTGSFGDRSSVVPQPNDKSGKSEQASSRKDQQSRPSVRVTSKDATDNKIVLSCQNSTISISPSTITASGSVWWSQGPGSAGWTVDITPPVAPQKQLCGATTHFYESADQSTFTCSFSADASVPPPYTYKVDIPGCKEVTGTINVQP